MDQNVNGMPWSSTVQHGGLGFLSQQGTKVSQKQSIITVRQIVKSL